MAQYEHGTYGRLGPSISMLAEVLVNAATYVGRAPVHLAKKSGLDVVNRPVLITSFEDAVNKIGYSDDWENFDLCEAIDAHFLNRIKPIGPIVIINVFDPLAMREDAEVTREVNLRVGRAIWKDDLCIPSSICIEGKALGKDYVTGHDTETGNITLRDLSGTIPPTVSITYMRAKPDEATADVVIGDMDEDKNPTGIKAIATVYQGLGVIPNILCSPGWSSDEGVHAALIAASQRIDGQWYAFVNSEMPVSPEVNTIDKAIDWKRASTYTNEFEAPCWPMAYKGDKRYHISTLATVVMMQTDAANDGIPFETPSNKPVDVTGYFIEEGKRRTYLREQANDLNAAGIRTILHNGGRWVLWGPHTGAYGGLEKTRRCCCVRAYTRWSCVSCRTY